jgi:hypothetical protein
VFLQETNLTVSTIDERNKVEEREQRNHALINFMQDTFLLLFRDMRDVYCEGAVNLVGDLESYIFFETFAMFDGCFIIVLNQILCWLDRTFR